MIWGLLKFIITFTTVFSLNSFVEKLPWHKRFINTFLLWNLNFKNQNYGLLPDQKIYLPCGISDQNILYFSFFLFSKGCNFTHLESYFKLLCGGGRRTSAVLLNLRCANSNWKFINFKYFLTYWGVRRVAPHVPNTYGLDGMPLWLLYVC